MNQITPIRLPESGTEHVDVIVVGAGLSGIAAGYYLQTKCPGRSYAILEARDAIGGTWDLFRYPGIRSDSDLFTFGFSFRPWRSDQALADGPSIRNYVRETAEEFGIDRKIRFGIKVTGAAWDSAAARWTLTTHDREGTEKTLTCNFLFACAGYYDYDGGYMPGWPGLERFTGQVIHPQAWPEDLDYAGKRVVVIGSGATAVTLIPAMADRTAHITMLQRSPTWITSLPARDRLAAAFNRALPERLAHRLNRWKYILLSMFFFTMCKKRPEKMKAFLHKGARAFLPADYDIATHLTPRYNPWDQRLCMVPDGDLFRAIAAGRASIETGTIESFTEAGIRLADGRELPADIVVTATGLQLKMLGGMTLAVDGRPVDPATTWFYKGMMLSGVPNLAVAIGYTNASWTLKAELTCRYVCRLLNTLARRGDDWCAPRFSERFQSDEPVLNLNSGYIVRAKDLLPKQGNATPWRVHQNYIRDLMAMRFGAVDDGTMSFGKAEEKEKVLS